MNPARELHAILSNWQKPSDGGSTRSARIEQEQGEARYPVEQGRVIEAGWLLGEIANALSALAAARVDVEAYEKFLPAWWEAVFVPDRSWASGVPQGTMVVPWETLATLKMCAGFFDATGYKPYHAASGSFDAARGAASEIYEVLREQDDIGQDEKQYVFVLLNQLRVLLDAKDLGVTVNLIQKVNELRGWLAAYEDYLESQLPGNPVVKKLKSLGRKLLPPGKAAFGAAGFVISAAADLTALTQGPTGG